MSAIAACCGEEDTPDVAPATHAATRKTGTDDDAPNQLVATPEARRPPITRRRRETRPRRRRPHPVGRPPGGGEPADPQAPPADPVGQVAPGPHHKQVAE